MSTYSERDRKALTWGALGVGAILAFNYVISPVWQRWSETGDLLASREAFVASFRQRVEARDSLRARRDVLALRLGSLRVLHDRVEAADPDGAPKKDAGKPEAGRPEGTDPEGKLAEPQSAGGRPADGEKAQGATESGVAAPNTAASTPNTSESGPDGSIGDKTSLTAGEAPAPAADLIVARNEAEAADVAGDKSPTTSDAPDVPTKPVEKNDEKADEAKANPDRNGEQESEAKPGEKPDASKDDKADGEKSGKPERAAVPVIEASSLATYIEKNAMAAKIKLKRITPKKSTSGKKGTKHFEPVTLQVNFECQVTNLVQLLHDLEKGELLVRVDKLEITRDVAQGDKLNASLDLSSYEPIGGTS